MHLSRGLCISRNCKSSSVQEHDSNLRPHRTLVRSKRTAAMGTRGFRAMEVCEHNCLLRHVLPKFGMFGTKMQMNVLRSVHMLSTEEAVLGQGVACVLLADYQLQCIFFQKIEDSVSPRLCFQKSQISRTQKCGPTHGNVNPGLILAYGCHRRSGRCLTAGSWSQEQCLAAAFNMCAEVTP